MAVRQTVRWRVLGPLAVRDATGETVTLRASKQRLLLGVLLLHPRHTAADLAADRLPVGLPGAAVGPG